MSIGPFEQFFGAALSCYFLHSDKLIFFFSEAINDINPSIKLGEDGINSVLVTLQGLRERALSASLVYHSIGFLLPNERQSQSACRACIYAIHGEIIRLVELQHAFRQLSYFDIMGRSRLTIKLTRVTLTLPFALERALLERRTFDVEGASEKDKEGIFPRRVTLLIRGVDIALERMESILS